MRRAHPPRAPASPRCHPWRACAGYACRRAVGTPDRRTGPRSCERVLYGLCREPTARMPVANDSGLSACIIIYNEADRIEACLRSVDFCDEIIVVDSHSTDRTRELAAACGARVIERDWPGYRSQKQFAVAAARHDWVLCLDADERLTPQLREEILAARAAGVP